MPIPFLEPGDITTPFPSPESALRQPNGLLCAGADLSPQRLLAAYCNGIFPWYSDDEPILWWSPDPRCVIHADQLHISRSLRRQLNKGDMRVTENRAFREVMTACAAPRASGSGTWISGEMIDAYTRLYESGYARSIEVWQDDALVGGMYGIEMGRIFIGESMFSVRPNASKIAMVYLCRHAGYALLDCQISNPHLMRMGAINISRGEYLSYLRKWAPNEFFVRRTATAMPYSRANHSSAPAHDLAHNSGYRA